MTKTVLAVAVAGVVVAAITVLAGLRLASAGADSNWIPIYQDVVKTSFQALAVGGLGGLAKLIFDQRKARETDAAELRKVGEAAAAELRDRRYGFISTLVGISHDIDSARTVIRANRSVKSWTDMANNRIIPASCRLRDMINELKNWAEAGLPVFDDTTSADEPDSNYSAYRQNCMDALRKMRRSLEPKAFRKPTVAATVGQGVTPSSPNAT
jgi:hypothetical protein